VSTCGRFPDTAIVRRPLETNEEAVTQLPSGELRAGGVKARRPRADHARGRSEATSLARRRAQLEARLRDGRELSPGAALMFDQPDDGEVRFQEDVSEP
jgi:hypothetical protein